MRIHRNKIFTFPQKQCRHELLQRKVRGGSDGVQAEGEITRWWEVELTYACVQICVYWRWDRSDNEASWRLFSSSRRSLEINGPQTHEDKTSSTHLVSDWKAPEPSNATSAPFARPAAQREQIHLRSVCRSSPSLPRARTAQRFSV